MNHIRTAKICLLFLLAACNRQTEGFTSAELDIINGTDSIMRVLTIEDPEDLAVLRASSTDLSYEMLTSPEYEKLAELMVATVTHPSQDGVGIAGPQVGLNRRVVAVQRFDKEPVLRGDKLDHPFEVYPNIRIVWASDSLAAGPEGCLSVPDRRGEVLRSQEIVIEYTSVPAGSAEAHPAGNNNIAHPTENTAAACPTEGSSAAYQTGSSASACPTGGSSAACLPTVRDTVRGFTAVIFQHEIDHLDGILYIDRL